MIDELVRCNGYPDGARRTADADPPEWVWRFSADTVIHYTVTETVGGLLFGGRVRRVLIRAIEHAPRIG